MTYLALFIPYTMWFVLGAFLAYLWLEARISSWKLLALSTAKQLNELNTLLAKTQVELALARVNQQVYERSLMETSGLPVEDDQRVSIEPVSQVNGCDQEKVAV